MTEHGCCFYKFLTQLLSDWYFGGVTGDFSLTGKILDSLVSEQCSVALLIKTDAQVTALNPHVSFCVSVCAS